MAVYDGGSPVNEHATAGAKSVDNEAGKVLTVDVIDAGRVNIALDMPLYQIGVTEDGEPVTGGGHRCGIFDLADAAAFRDALTAAIEFSIAQAVFEASSD